MIPSNECKCDCISCTTGNHKDCLECIILSNGLEASSVDFSELEEISESDYKKLMKVGGFHDIPRI